MQARKYSNHTLQVRLLTHTMIIYKTRSASTKASDTHDAQPYAFIHASVAKFLRACIQCNIYESLSSIPPPKWGMKLNLILGKTTGDAPKCKKSRKEDPWFRITGESFLLHRLQDAYIFLR